MRQPRPVRSRGALTPIQQLLWLAVLAVLAFATVSVPEPLV